MRDATCEMCPFWAQYPVRDQAQTIHLGDCRCHPPTVTTSAAEDPRDLVDFHSLFPYTAREEWCGDHPDRIAAAKAKRKKGTP